MTNSEIDDALMDVMESRIGLQHDFAPSVCIADAWRVIRKYILIANFSADGYAAHGFSGRND